MNEHLGNIFASGELVQAATVRNFRIVQSEGNRPVSRDIAHGMTTATDIEQRRNAVTAKLGAGLDI